MSRSGRLMTSSLVLSAAVVLTAFSAAISPQVADACGGFFRQRNTTTATIPSLQVEQVLIVHDPIKEEEHFIREIVFRDAKEPFGFVVPTPTQPKVAKIEKSPFLSLANRFPPEPPVVPSLGFGSGKGRGVGAAGGGAAEPQKVTVISQEKVGSFTAFVLSATDATALKKWLDDNELVTTAESEAWLKHYTDLGFYFVALRHDQPKGDAAKATTRSETMNITFSTPVPFYPYLEPDHPAGTPTSPYRVLAVWLLSPKRSIPLATQKENDNYMWKHPWKEARKHPRQTPQDLKNVVGSEIASLLPDNVDLEVQTFEDQKAIRKGWGDVFLVPEQPESADSAKVDRLRKAMLSLDPSLVVTK